MRAGHKIVSIGTHSLYASLRRLLIIAWNCSRSVKLCSKFGEIIQFLPECGMQLMSPTRQTFSAARKVSLNDEIEKCMQNFSNGCLVS